MAAFAVVYPAPALARDPLRDSTTASISPSDATARSASLGVLQAVRRRSSGPFTLFHMLSVGTAACTRRHDRAAPTPRPAMTAPVRRVRAVCRSRDRRRRYAKAAWRLVPAKIVEIRGQRDLGPEPSRSNGGEHAGVGPMQSIGGAHRTIIKPGDRPLVAESTPNAAARRIAVSAPTTSSIRAWRSIEINEHCNLAVRSASPNYRPARTATSRSRPSSTCSMH